MKPNEITAQIVHAAYRVHTQLGPGLLETVPEQRGDPVGSGKDFRAESAENAERAQGACGVGEAVDMAIPPKTARNHLPRKSSKGSEKGLVAGILGKSYLIDRVISLPQDAGLGVPAVSWLRYAKRREGRPPATALRRATGSFGLLQSSLSQISI
jgi:hypothetical protein